MSIVFKQSLKKNTIIYTDGSSKANGKKNAVSGIGVFFGDSDPRNVSMETKLSIQKLIPTFDFTGYKNTNNIAELMAIYAALYKVRKELKNKDNFVIKSDSQYSINSLTIWRHSWAKNGWKTSTGKAVLNKEIILAITCDFLIPFKTQITFMKVKAHTMKPFVESPLYQDWYGNYKADLLATTFS
jgi:ribonuclease HI